ncbi:FmdB family zinc ribbon protein [Kocuria arenosa]|uniref:FmdB family zinc ribbon protein n=1 Tax=Kocuria arenosa TaxID=3071446 RepID=UPI0034D7589E
MPVYAYACKDCGHAFDIRQSFSEDALTVCPECDGGLRKKFNTVGVVFKGSGFYRNDSRSGADSGASTSDAAGTVPATTATKTAAPATAGAVASSSPSASTTAGGSSD